MKVLHVVPTFYPATKWGGPIFSTKAICDGIAQTPGVDLRVLTTDAASPDRRDRIGVRPNLGYPVHYARRVFGHSTSPGLLARLPAAIAWADVVHLTATYSFPTLPTLALAAFLNKPVVWSPRGALLATADWDAAPNKRIKHVIEKCAQVLRPSRTVLHVTSDAEATLGLDNLRGIDTAMIPNAVSLPEICRPRRTDDKLRLIFLSRLHEKKGVDLLLDAMDALPAHVELDIYGTGAPDYVQSIAARAAAFGGRVRLHGHVNGAAKDRAFADADLFVLPTHSENFGIAIAEALAHGVPVITTKAAPWQGLEVEGCGRWLDLQTADLAEEILEVARYGLPAMGARGRAWMRRDFSHAAMVAAFAQLYAAQLPLSGEASPA